MRAREVGGAGREDGGEAGAAVPARPREDPGPRLRRGGRGGGAVCWVPLGGVPGREAEAVPGAGCEMGVGVRPRVGVPGRGWA